MAAIDDKISAINASLLAEETVEGGVIALLTNLSQQLALAQAAAIAGGATSAQLSAFDAIKFKIDNDGTGMATAIVVNTSAQPVAVAPANQSPTPSATTSDLAPPASTPVVPAGATAASLGVTDAPTE
jgi:hypothetical protein